MSTFFGGGGPLPAGVGVTLDPQAEPPLLDRLGLPRRLHDRHGVWTLELFADRGRAFYGQAAPVELPPLPADMVADYIAARFEATNRDVGAALAPPLVLARGHPQRTMFLAHTL